MESDGRHGDRSRRQGEGVGRDARRGSRDSRRGVGGRRAEGMSRGDLRHSLDRKKKESPRMDLSYREAPRIR